MERLGNALAVAAGAVNEQIVQHEKTVESINRSILLLNVLTITEIVAVIFTIFSFSLIALAITGIIVVGRFHFKEHLNAKIEQIRGGLNMIGLHGALKGWDGDILKRPIYIKFN